MEPPNKRLLLLFYYYFSQFKNSSLRHPATLAWNIPKYSRAHLFTHTHLHLSS